MEQDHTWNINFTRAGWHLNLWIYVFPDRARGETQGKSNNSTRTDAQLSTFLLNINSLSAAVGFNSCMIQEHPTSEGSTGHDRWNQRKILQAPYSLRPNFSVLDKFPKPETAAELRTSLGVTASPGAPNQEPQEQPNGFCSSGRGWPNQGV